MEPILSGLNVLRANQISCFEIRYEVTGHFEINHLIDIRGKLEQLESLHSEDTHLRPMITHSIVS